MCGPQHHGAQSRAEGVGDHFVNTFVNVSGGDNRIRFMARKTGREEYLLS